MLGFPQIISFLTANEYHIEDERTITNLESETLIDALYFVSDGNQILTTLIQVGPATDFEKLQVKSNITTGAILRHKIRAISKGLKHLGISSTFQMIDLLRPDPKNIKFIFSKVIHFFEYLNSFKKHCAPSFTSIVRPFLRGTS